MPVNRLAVGRTAYDAKIPATGVTSFGQTPREQAPIVREKRVAGMRTTLCGLLDLVRRKGQRRVEAELRWNATDIAVAVKNGVVTLTGFVRSYAQKLEAEQTADGASDRGNRRTR